jgi:hypothetical protein
MMKHVKLLAWAILISFKSFGQQEYLAGVGRESLMPGQESFSLALAGYGAPREGRFTLDWEKKASLEPGAVLAGIDGVLYALHPKGGLQQAPMTRFPLQWAPAGKARAGKSLTGEKGALWLLDASGKVYRCQGAGQSWRKVGQAPQAKEIVVAGNSLYGLGIDGVFRKASLEKKKWQWQTVARLKGAVSFVVHRQTLYAATGTDTLWRFNLHHAAGGWVKAGYDNQQIRQVRIQKLLTVHDKLYAVDEQGGLFEATKNEGREADALYATALALRQHQQTTLLLCVDLCGFDDSMVKEVKQELSRQRGLPAAAILVNASHTHFAPVTQLWATWGPHNQVPDSLYLNGVVKPALLRAAEKALDQMRPANLYFGRGHTTIGRNRSNNGQDTPYDDAVDVLKVETRDGKNNYVLVLAGCHPVFGTAGRQNYTLSSNYPGYMRQRLEENQPNTTALFMQGCAGDINPRDNQPEVTGHKLAADAGQVLGQEMTPLQGSLSFYLDTLQAPAAPWDRDKIARFRQENLKEPGNVDMEKNVRWADIMLKKHDSGTMPRHLPVYIQTINIGNWKLVGLSREVVTEYSTGIKAIWPDKLVSVAGYCNDVASYLPVERHIRTGVYEGYNSFLWYGQPSAFPDNIFDLVIERVRDKNY